MCLGSKCCTLHAYVYDSVLKVVCVTKIIDWKYCCATYLMCRVEPTATLIYTLVRANVVHHYTVLCFSSLHTQADWVVRDLPPQQHAENIPARFDARWVRQPTAVGGAVTGASAAGSASSSGAAGSDAPFEPGNRWTSGFHR